LIDDVSQIAQGKFRLVRAERAQHLQWAGAPLATPMRVTTEEELAPRMRALNSDWLKLARGGNFERAWQISDQLLELCAHLDCSRWPRHQQFIWRGQCLRGRRVLIRCYHGLGDTIQFVRFLPQVRAIAYEVVLWAQPQLIPLLGTMSSGAHRILPLHDGAPAVEYDVDLELFEVLHALRVPATSLAPECPYLLAEDRNRPARGSRLRVGLVWRSGGWDDTRSIAPALLAPLGALDGIEWQLFQRGPGLEEWPHTFGTVPVLGGVLDEARAMRGLDLLISVDTCSAHLAGALGVPVWTLLPHAADWRWMEDRADTPWYPTMQLIRQPVAGDWQSAIAEVMRRLSCVRASR
jgi:hypothetical protein